MGELAKAVTELLVRLDQLPMSVKAGWIAWVAVGGVLLQWRRVGRTAPVWLPPPAPRRIRAVDQRALLEPIPVSVSVEPMTPKAEPAREPERAPKRRRRSRHTTLSISPAAG